MLLLAIAVSLGALLGTIASALPATAVTAGPGASPGAAWSLAGGGLNTSLTISSTPIELASGFWGTTISSRVPLFANESYLVNATQDRTVVWPGANAGDQYDPFTNLTWTDGNQATLALTTEVQFINWCRAVHCNAIFEAPGEIDDPQLAAALVNYTEKTLAFHPVAWEIGNEPGFWNHWGQPWGTWTSKTTAPTSTQYAWEVWNYERAMRLADPTISIIGLPGVGKTLSGDSIAHWISQVIKVDGPNISAIAIHVYPDLSTQNDTLAQFYHTLAKSNIQSIPARVPTLRSAIAADIKSCTGCGAIPLLFTEIGAAITGRPDADHYATQYPGALYMAAEVTQAMGYNVSNIDSYATVLGAANSWFTPSGIGHPLYVFESEIASRLGSEAHVVSFAKGPGGLYGIATVDRAHGNRSDLLVVNTNVTTSANFWPELPVALSGTPWVVRSWVNGTTTEPVSTFYAGAPGAFTLAPNSLVLFESQPYNVVPVHFAQSGLPSGTRWFVSVGPTTGVSLTPNITFYLPPGSYSVGAGPAIPVAGDVAHERWLPTPPASILVAASAANVSVPYDRQFTVGLKVLPEDTGRILPSVQWWTYNTPLTLTAVANPGWVFRTWTGVGPGNYSGPAATTELRPTGAINESAIFVPGYLVNFTERGLVSGTNWSLSVAGRNYTSNGSSVYLLAANGTYGYRVAPVGDEIPHPMAGALVVNGTAPPPISIEFATPEVGYSVSFVETGLPLGANWSVVLRGVIHASTTPVINTVEPNGTYAYNVTPIPGYLAHPPRGGFIVSGANLSLAVLYTPIPAPRAVYGVTFAEDGLPAGATWSIAVRNVTVLSSGPDLTVFEPNGTYSFSVGTVPGFTPHPPNGGFFVNGTSPTAVAVNFTHTPTGSTAAFPVIWVETGLAPNVSWSVSVRHTLYTSTASYIVAAERDGNYTYNVTPIAGYFDRPQMGGFSVQGISPALLPVTFQRAYQLTFSAVGLPVGSAWHVRVGVVWEGGSGSTLTLLVPTGNWSFVVVPPPHYNALPIQGSILVGNSSFNQTIIFALTIYEVDPTGVVISAALAEYRAILVGTVIAIAATAIFAVLGRRSGVEEGDHLTGPFPTGPGAVLGPGGPSAAAVEWTTTAPSPPMATASTSGGRSPDVAWGVSGLMADSRRLVAAMQAVGGNASAAIQPLGEIRWALAAGDSGRARRALTTANDVLSHQLLPLYRLKLGGVRDLVGAVREFGGDLTVSTARMVDGRRFLAAGDVIGAYDSLEQARRQLLEQLTPSVHRCMVALLPRVRSVKLSVDDAAVVARAVRQVGESLRRQRYADAVRVYRRLDSLIGTLGGQGASEPAGSGLPVSPPLADRPRRPYSAEPPATR